MSGGPHGKGPRLWLQPERKNANGSVERSRWVIRDGGLKRSTGCAPSDIAGAERALSEYIGQKHDPRSNAGVPAKVSIIDVLTIYARDIAPSHARPKETASKIERLASWWGNPAAARTRAQKAGSSTPHLTGMVSDVTTANCRAYVEFVGFKRSASRDLEILRAALNHARKERVLDAVVDVYLPGGSVPRDRWLTRSEVAQLLWTAWRSRRSANGRSGAQDEWQAKRHLVQFILLATYTGSRRGDVLNACFEQRSGCGYIDLERGIWIRKPAGKVATAKRQPSIPLPGPLLAHLRRWRRQGQTFAVEFNGRKVESVSKAFRKLVKDCGLGSDVVPHTLRHTGVTWGMQSGMDTWLASGYFGMTVEVLLNVYGHHHPDHLREAADKMARPRR
jgi:integrase